MEGGGAAVGGRRWRVHLAASGTLALVPAAASVGLRVAATGDREAPTAHPTEVTTATAVQGGEGRHDCDAVLARAGTR